LASHRQILLKDDNPESLEALFEHAYNHTYTEAKINDTAGLAGVLFKQHVYAFATADKYRAEGLGELASHRLEELVTICTELKKDLDTADHSPVVATFR
jgi:hypothetical protein